MPSKKYKYKMQYWHKNHLLNYSHVTIGDKKTLDRKKKQTTTILGIVS